MVGVSSKQWLGLLEQVIVSQQYKQYFGLIERSTIRIKRTGKEKSRAEKKGKETKKIKVEGLDKEKLEK